MPGFFTDFLGLLLLIPPVRALLIRRGRSRMTVRAATFVRRRPGAQQDRPETIDVDYEVVEDPGPRTRGASGWTRPQ